MLDSLVIFDFSALAAAAVFKFLDFFCFDGVVAPPWSSAIAASNYSELKRSLASFPGRGTGWDGAWCIHIIIIRNW